MARPWQETVEDFPALRRKKVYRVRIQRVRKSPKPKGMRVQLEFLDEEQAGRMHEVFVHLPIRPAGLTASLFTAAGMELAVGKRIPPTDVIGAMVGVPLAPTETGVWTVTGFEKLEMEEIHDSDARSQHADVPAP